MAINTRTGPASQGYSAHRHSAFKLPNGLTAFRMVVIPFIVFCLLSSWQYSYLVAATLFGLGAVSDTLDGYMARRQGLVSKLGVFLDLTADKLLIAAVLITLVEVKTLPAWLVIIVICREFLITGVRTYAAAEGVVIAAKQWGKLKMVVTNVAVFMVMLDADLQRGGALASVFPSGSVPAVLGLGIWVMYLALALTLVSGLQYMILAAPLLKEEAAKQAPDWDE